MNFTSNKEEDNCIRWDNDETRQEESKEDGKSFIHVAISTTVKVSLCSSNNRNNNNGDQPGSSMVKLFHRFSISVSSYNHLIEIKSNTESPNEISNEEIVENHGTRDAEDSIIYIEGKIEEDLGKEDAETKIDNQLDRIGT